MPPDQTLQRRIIKLCENIDKNIPSAVMETGSDDVTVVCKQNKTKIVMRILVSAPSVPESVKVDRTEVQNAI